MSLSGITKPAVLGQDFSKTSYYVRCTVMIIGRSPGLRRTINHRVGLVSSGYPEVQVQDPRRDVYLVLSTSSTCQLILLAAADLIASQLISSRCRPTARRPFLSVFALVLQIFKEADLRFSSRYKRACSKLVNIFHRLDISFRFLNP